MEEKTKEPGKIDGISTVITISTALIVCVSVIYSTSYFLIVGSEFQGFMSTSGYLLDSIRLIPVFITAFIIGIVSSMMIRLVFGNKLPIKRTDINLRKGLIIVAFASLFLFPFIVISDNLLKFYGICLFIAIIIWIDFMAWLLSEINTDDTISPLLVTIFYICVPVIIFVALDGMKDANRDLNGLGSALQKKGQT